MTPQRRSALLSVAAAAVLAVLKLTVGLATHSLGLLSEAAHSGTDLVAALLTYFAVRVAPRPADVTHQFGHGKAEHLSALAEAGFLALVSIFISALAIERLAGIRTVTVHVTWYAFACSQSSSRRLEPHGRLPADRPALRQRSTCVECPALRE